MRRKSNEKTTSKVLLILLSLLCAVLILFSLLGDSVTGPVRRVTGSLIAPVQKGINSVGSWLSGLTSNFSDASALRRRMRPFRSGWTSLRRKTASWFWIRKN